MTQILTLLRSFLLCFIVLAGAISLIIPEAGQSIILVAGLAGWITLDTFLYLVIIVLAGLVTLVSLKYRTVVVELKELAETIRKGYADDKLTDEERKAILKAAVDVLLAIIRIAWKPVGLTAKTIKRAVQ